MSDARFLRPAVAVLALAATPALAQDRDTAEVDITLAEIRIDPTISAEEADLIVRQGGWNLPDEGDTWEDPTLGLSERERQLVLGTTTTPQNPTNDAEVLRQLYNENLNELRLASFLVERVTEPEALDYVLQLQRDHTVANLEVLELADQEGVRLGLGPAEHEVDSNLAAYRGLSGDGLTDAIARHMAGAHGQAIADLQRVADTVVQDGDLRDHIEDELIPSLQEHEQLARALGADRYDAVAVDFSPERYEPFLVGGADIPHGIMIEPGRAPTYDRSDLEPAVVYGTDTEIARDQATGTYIPEVEVLYPRGTGVGAAPDSTTLGMFESTDLPFDQMYGAIQSEQLGLGEAVVVTDDLGQPITIELEG